MGKRVTLTKAQAASQFGRSLIAFFHATAEDGRLSLVEVRQLATLLREAPAELPAAEFLRPMVSDVLADGELDDLEAYELRLAIERVVPLAVRTQLKAKLAGIERPPELRECEDDEDEDDGGGGSVTDRQLQYIRALGGNPSPGLSKWAASDLIDALKARRPPSPRQIMVLRFWNRMELANRSKAEVCAWLDQFYAEDGGRERAWERFKSDYSDDGSQRDPSWVPIGAGYKYHAPVAGVDTRRVITGASPPGALVAGRRALWKLPLVTAAVLAFLVLVFYLLYLLVT